MVHPDLQSDVPAAKPKEEHKERLNFSLDPAIVKRLRAHAEKEERSLVWIVEKALDAYLPKPEKSDPQ